MLGEVSGPQLVVPPSCSGWTWAAETPEGGWVQHHGFEASKTHLSPAKQENRGERTKQDRNQGEGGDGDSRRSEEGETQSAPVGT